MFLSHLACSLILHPMRSAHCGEHHRHLGFGRRRLLTLRLILPCCSIHPAARTKFPATRPASATGLILPDSSIHPVARLELPVVGPPPSCCACGSTGAPRICYVGRSTNYGTMLAIKRLNPKCGQGPAHAQNLRHSLAAAKSGIVVKVSNSHILLFKI